VPSLCSRLLIIQAVILSARVDLVRGIERRDIFVDDIDQKNFVDRVTTLFPETSVHCYT
jgi:hypothetical protein